MNLVRILKLFQRNLPLLIGVPLVLVAIAKYLTRNPTLKYESETTIYTGLASGYTLEQSKGFNLFATNNAFDNLINIIKSREVASETGIRLFTMYLMMDKPDSRILKVNWENLQKRTPAHIKALLIKKGQMELSAGTFGNQFSDTIFLVNNDFVVDDKLFHLVKPDETIFSIAKQYNVSVSELLNINNLTSYYLNPGSKIIVKDVSDGSPEEKMQLFDSANVQKKRDLNKDLYEKNVQKLMQYAYANDTNYLYGLLNSGNPYFGIKAIQSVTVKRVQSSDLINIKYTSFDPGICQQTLIILTEVFIRKFKSVNENQSDAVVRYFINEVNKAAVRLRQAEDRLLEFNKTNNIINYYEQSKAVANMKEDLDQKYSESRMNYEAAAAVLQKLEEKLGVQGQIQLKTDQIVKTRNRLSEITSNITLTEVYNDPDPKNRAKLEELKSEAARLKKQLEDYVSQLYTYTNTIDGLPLNDLLQQWLVNVIKYEESKATMEVLAQRIQEFYEYYKTFAPLGATQKRIEREINVAEQEYLSLLHSLNLSKLKQQDIELSSNIKAVDPPYYPLKPLKGKEGILVIVAGLFGFIFVAFLIIALEYLDNTIRTADRLEELSKLRIAGVFPRIINRYAAYNLPFITNRLIELTVHNIRLNVRQNQKHVGPALVIIFSSLKKEGKTFMGARLAEKFREFGEQTAFLTFVTSNNLNDNEWLTQPGFSGEPVEDNSLQDDLRKKSTKGKANLRSQKKKTVRRTTAEKLIPMPIAHDDNFRYLVDKNFTEVSSLSELNYLERRPIFSDYKFILLELPGTIYNPYPIDLVAQADSSLMITRSNRSWKKADTLALFTMVKIFKEKPLAFLNGVEIEEIENILGDLPRQRSRLRRIFKKLITLQLKDRTAIK
ncbi:MAG: LysM peptidoglycan-binding domain-containing protein [Bacteroidales bacterium]